MDIAIINGTVVDGTGAPRMRADLGITDDRIVAVGPLPERAGRIIDATGRIVAPGFIDAHAHSDFALLRDPLNPDTTGTIIDRGGDSNTLTSHRPMSKFHIGIATGSTLLEVEKADLDALAKEYPEGWAGKYSTWKKEGV